MPSLSRILAGIFAAKVLTLIGMVALVLGLVWIMEGMKAAWLTWSGAFLSFTAFTALFLLTRRMRTALDRMAVENLTTIYMPLMNEGVDAWRPVEAMKITELGYMVTEDAPSGEEWAFQPGHILQCEERQMSGETCLVAVAKAT